MKPELAGTLAWYFTDAERVVHHSIGLEVGGKSKTEALAFFKVRGALGITGYVDAVEAATLLRDL